MGGNQYIGGYTTLYIHLHTQTPTPTHTCMYTHTHTHLPRPRALQLKHPADTSSDLHVLVVADHDRVQALIQVGSQLECPVPTYDRSLWFEGEEGLVGGGWGDVVQVSTQ